MAYSESLHLDQRIGLRLSQQHLRFVKLLELTAPELDDAVRRELQENPALTPSSTEIPDNPPSVDRNTSSPYPSLSYRYSSGNETEWPEQADFSETLADYLHRQLDELSLSSPVATMAAYIVDSLDSNGWLRRPLLALRNDLIFSANIEISDEDAEEAFNVVRNLDPPGVGALSLQDCLLIQLRHLPDSDTVKDAIFILEEHFEAFAMKHSHRIISALDLNHQRADKALNLILSLNPKPGAAFSGRDTNNIIVPDVIVEIEDENISLKLNNRIPELQIDTSFESALSDMKAAEVEARKNKGNNFPRKKGADFVATRLRDARDFIKILSQRQQTILRVATAIVHIQKDYFLTRDVYSLHPMMIKDIAAITGLDISVISRATGNKYLGTPWGTFPMRFFFSDTIGDNEGAEAITNRKIEAEISRLVNNEDKRHPLSDEKIKIKMEEAGFEISRRTVAKYRDRMGIPVARLRKNLTN